MSGEPTVVLAGSASADRLVAALAELTAVEPGFVLVGGLAVMARLAEVHRATQDLDALVTGAEFTDAVVALRGGELASGRLTISGIEIDRIEIPGDATWDEIEELHEPIDRLFTGGHLWAMRTAALLRITTEEAEAVVPVAVAPGLLATKLHAFSSPRRVARKRSSDALDVLRLGQLLVREPEERFDGAPTVVVDAIRWAITAGWRDDPTGVVRRLRGLGSSAPIVTEGEVEALAKLLVEALPA